MSKDSRVLYSGKNQITQTYAQHCAKVSAGQGWAKGVDVVKHSNNLDWIIAHTEGEVVYCVDYIKAHELDKQAMGYGNYILIKHPSCMVNGCTFYTLYAHLEYGSIKVKKGDKVDKGQILAYAGNTGNSYGGHLHLELRFMRNDVVIENDYWHNTKQFWWSDPTPFLNADLPSTAPAKATLSVRTYPNYTDGRLYRVRKSFTDERTSIGSYSVWANAYNSWYKNKSRGYHIYDASGIQLD